MQILLIDDHVMFRQGIQLLLSDFDEQLNFCSAGTCEQALALLKEEPLDLILLELKLPDTQGLGALLQIRASYPDIPLVVLSNIEDPVTIQETIDAGASGFVPKSSNPKVLMTAMKAVLAGEVYLAPAAPKMLVDAPYNPELAEQAEVIQKFFKGKSNRTIAREMGIPKSKVKAHLSMVYKVLGGRKRKDDEDPPSTFRYF